MRSYYDKNFGCFLKKCPTCGETKKTDYFFRSKNYPDGLCVQCKSCMLKYQKRYYKKHPEKRKGLSRIYREKRKTDKKVFLTVVYQKLNNRTKCKTGGKKRYYGMSLCSKDDFINYALNNDVFNYLYSNWQMKNFKHKLIPTVDRIDNSKGYGLSNIQFLTLSDNSKKGIMERDGKL